MPGLLVGPEGWPLAARGRRLLPHNDDQVVLHADESYEPDGVLPARGGIDLHRLLINKQKKLLAEQESDHEIHQHPTASGDAGEVNWHSAIQSYLPQRYEVSRQAFVIDAKGDMVPEQIDVLIHDHHFCPLWFEDKAGIRYVPAESVYAALEVKPVLTREYVEYAARKVASVRVLDRTSAPIIDRGEIKPPREPFEILGGILTLKSGWSPPFGEPFRKVITEQAATPATRIDIGCALGHGGFELVGPPAAPKEAIELSEPATALMFFLLRLFGRLQGLGSPTAIDMREYSKTLRTGELLLVADHRRQA
jgi:hypothetical protein